MASDESLQQGNHYTLVITTSVSNKNGKTKTLTKMYKTRTTSGISDVLTTNIMADKSGCVTTYST